MPDEEREEVDSSCFKKKKKQKQKTSRLFISEREASSVGIAIGPSTRQYYPADYSRARVVEGIDADFDNGEKCFSDYRGKLAKLHGRPVRQRQQRQRIAAASNRIVAWIRSAEALQ